jgi:murein DD-endopeptidase MepM/ murein hydrolase activator NlpD
MPDPDVPPRPLTRRQLLAGLAVGAGIGALGLGRLGASQAGAADDLAALDGAGSAIARAERLRLPTGPGPGGRWPNGFDAGVLTEPPEGKVIFPLLPGDSCGFHDDGYYQPRGNRLHGAIDIMSTPDRPVYAVSDGQLATRYTPPGDDPHAYGSGWGWELQDTSSNRNYRYFHCREWTNGFALGDRVRRGDVIAFVGDTGTSAGNYHLHFEVREGSSQLDPSRYVDVPETCSVW